MHPDRETVNRGFDEKGRSAQSITGPRNRLSDVASSMGINSDLCCRKQQRMRRSVALQEAKFARGQGMDDILPELGDLEREVMQLVWANAPITAEAVRERLSRRLKESTVRTVLRRLEQKGFTTHTVDGRTYVYHAAELRGRVAAKAVQRIVDWFCNGSVDEVLVGMVDTAMLDQRQLRMLADQVAKARVKARGGRK
jgi:BlaI family penicillinase repressor